MAIKMSKFIEKAREVINIEIEGLKAIHDHLNGGFSEMVEKCIETLENGGKLVLTGIGKSGYIGQKIAATLSSVGSPSVFMHPVEALHGDLGIMQSNDLVIALSYSGETEELLAVLTPAKRLGMELIAITASADSTLGKLSDIVVEMPVPQEACPFNLAPTTTTTALLALGDALALVLLDVRGFTKEDYGRLHPGGAIGRAVTMRVRDIMRSGERFTTVQPETKIKDTLLQMTKARCGSAIVTDDEGCLMGIFTDGDFRRNAENDLSILDKEVSSVMTVNPVAANADSLAAEVLKIVEDRHINDIIVLDENKKVIGLVDVQDLPGLKLM
jgi:arabinose-5-phosphate isomerase